MIYRHRRHSTRLSRLNYSFPNQFFVTICCHHHGCYFGKYPALQSTVQNEINQLAKRFTNISVDTSVVMPNHVHLIISIKSLQNVGASFMKPDIDITKSHRHMGVINHAPTLGHIIRFLKAKSSHSIHQQININPIWQQNYYEHRIRNQEEYWKYFNYIRNNPNNWDQDSYNPINFKHHLASL